MVIKRIKVDLVYVEGGGYTGEIETGDVDVTVNGVSLSQARDLLRVILGE